MVFIQGVIARSRYYTVIHFFQQLIQAAEGILSNFIDECFCGYDACKIKLLSTANFVFDKYFHDV